jgi:hypothetical protein
MNEYSERELVIRAAMFMIPVSLMIVLWDKNLWWLALVQWIFAIFWCYRYGWWVRDDEDDERVCDDTPVAYT